MDTNAAIRALAESVAELAQALADFDGLAPGEAYQLDAGRRFVIAQQLDVLAGQLRKDDLSMLASELRGDVAPTDDS